MAQLEILTAPDPLLRRTSVPVETFDAELQQFIDDMFETMYAASGIGLAAMQVGDLRSLVVIDLTDRDERYEASESEGEKHDPICLINPKIIRSEGTESYEEGCLSLPEVRATITRLEKVTISAQDRNGEPFELEADGLLAICIQHELDHLQGKLFIDHLSKLKQERLKKKMKKLAKHKS